MNFGDQSQQQSQQLSNNSNDVRRELALAMMNQRLRNSQSQGQVPLTQQQQQQQGRSSSLLDLYASQSNNLQDSSNPFFSLLQPSSSNPVMGMGGEEFSSTTRRDSVATAGSNGATSGGGSDPLFGWGLSSGDLNSPSAISTLYGGLGSTNAQTTFAAPTLTNFSSGSSGGGGGGDVGGVGGVGTGTNVTGVTNNIDSFTASMLRENALIRERILGRRGTASGGDLQFAPSSFPYRSLFGGSTSQEGTNVLSSSSAHSLQERLTANTGQMPTASESIMLARTRFLNGNNGGSSNDISSLQQQLQQQQQNSLFTAVDHSSLLLGGAGGMGNSIGNDTNNNLVEARKFPVKLPVVLAVPEDNQKLSNHQVLLRNQIEAFQATEDDLTTHTRGRNKPIKLGQVGIRCRHCARLPVARRQKGSTYFPASLHGLYQAAQNMNTTHMQSGLCTEMPLEYKQMFAETINHKVSSSVAGRPYWAKTARQLGLIDTEDGIRFIRDLTPSQINQIRTVQAQAQSRLPPGSRTTTSSSNTKTPGNNKIVPTPFGGILGAG